MINPIVRQHFAYCLIGSSKAYYDIITRDYSYAGALREVLIYNQPSIPPFYPYATRQWSAPSWMTWYQYDEFLWRNIYATLGTSGGGSIYYSYAYHVGSYESDPLFLAEYPLCYGTNMMVMQNNILGTDNNNVFVSITIGVVDTGSVIDMADGGDLLWGNFCGDDNGEAGGPGGYELNGSFWVTVYDDISGSRITATMASKSVMSDGTCATLVWRFGATAAFHVDRIAGTWRSVVDPEDHRLFELTPANDPFCYANPGNTTGWGWVYAGQLYLSTLFISFVEGSSNHNSYNATSLVGTILF